MATVKFILRKDKENSKGESPIYAQYIHLNSKLLVATGKKIASKYWDADNGKVKRHESALTLNKYLNKLENKILDIATDLQTEDKEPLANEVKEKYDNAKKEKRPEAELTRSLIYQWREYLNNRKETVKENTHSNQRNSLEALEAFLKKEKIESIRPEKFTLFHLTKWQNYLNSKNSNNTVAKRLKHLKSFLRYFEELGGKTGLTLSKIKYKENTGVKIYLTEEELEAWKVAPVEGINSVKVVRKSKTEIVYVNLEEVRDLFTIQCNTGLRISDLKRLDKNIKGHKIEITTKKTGVNIEIPINPTVREILNKYKNKLPQITEQKINVGIKEIYRICFPKNSIQLRKGNNFESVKVWELISTHDAIRTFITLSAERGMTVSAISTITGKTIKVLLTSYLSQSQKFAEKEMEKAWGASPLRIAK